jgi:hypothetical protein
MRFLSLCFYILSLDGEGGERDIEGEGVRREMG